jgi:hypothetical protein
LYADVFVNVFPVCIFVPGILNIMSYLEKARSSFNSCEWNIFAVKQKEATEHVQPHSSICISAVATQSSS